MVEIPPNAVTMQDLLVWDQMQAELKKLKAAEMLLRQKIFKFYFPTPKEGTNTVPLANQYVLKGKHTINREIDIGSFTASKDRFALAGIASDTLVEYKPALKLGIYRELTLEQTQLFDQCLIVKPGAPALEIALPAKAKKAGQNASDDNS